MAKITKSFPALLLALLCLVSLCHSLGSRKACQVEFSSPASCYGEFEDLSCFKEATSRYGQQPLSKCQCIPSGSQNSTCKCVIYCPTTD